MTKCGTFGRIDALHIYPVKGCGGIRLETSELGPLGLRHDRRWMIADAATGRFLSQRVRPMLATVRPSLLADSLQLALADGSRLELPLDDRGTPRTVEVWGDEVSAVEPDPRASAALGRWLGSEVILVRFPETAVRPCDPAYAPAGSRTGFADAFPLLLTTTASLEALNQTIARRGGAPVPMSRFRPNLVVDGVAALTEDQTRRVEIEGGPVLELVKRCERCAVTTIDQTTGKKTGKEPLASLALNRTDKTTGGVWFGQNAVPRLAPDETATLAVGAACRFPA
jgi:uncharacterized protein YcbX